MTRRPRTAAGARDHPHAPVQRGAIVELVVGKVGHGGFCVGHLDGFAVFVRHALPGEHVLARVTEVRPRYARADAVQVGTASPDRVSPPCPYAGPGRCGGCDWQHVALPAQRALKAAVIREQLARLAGLDWPVEVEELPGAPDGLGWRTRVRYAVRRDGVVGLRRHRSHDVEPVSHCRVAHPAAAAPAQDRWPGRVELAVAVSSTGEVSCRGEPVHERVGARAFTVGKGAFWQSHVAAAEVLRTGVLELLAPRLGERALDLYAGVGLFAAFLAQAVGPRGRVVAVEGDARAATDATANLTDLPQASVRRARITPELISRLGGATELDGVDLVVLDPPRLGAGTAVCAAIAALAPRAVVYVACDPAALARDVAALGKTGYRLERLRALDAFPMTAHVECLALLVPAATG